MRCPSDRMYRARTLLSMLSPTTLCPSSDVLLSVLAPAVSSVEHVLSHCPEVLEVAVANKGKNRITSTMHVVGK